jgi:hypothetical protein
MSAVLKEDFFFKFNDAVCDNILSLNNLQPVTYFRIRTILSNILVIKFNKYNLN